MKIFGDSISGNCLKVKWTADHLGLAYDWVETGVLQGETRTPAFLALNPAGQVPLVILDDGRPLAQSNAILLHLGRGSDLIPGDPYLDSQRTLVVMVRSHWRICCLLTFLASRYQWEGAHSSS